MRLNKDRNELMLVQYWVKVCDAGPILNQHWESYRMGHWQHLVRASPARHTSSDNVNSQLAMSLSDYVPEQATSHTPGTYCEYYNQNVDTTFYSLF